MPIDRREFKTTLPEIFRGLPLSYVETRRFTESEQDLSGNVTENELILRSAYAFQEETASEALWLDRQKTFARKRLEIVRSLGEFSSGLARSKPVHGNTILSADDRFEDFSIQGEYDQRIEADGLVTQTEGRGTLFTPADCPIINIAYIRGKAVRATVQLHAGSKGLINNSIGTGLRRLRALGLQPEQAVAYVGPHAHDYKLYGDFLIDARAHSLDVFLEGTHEDKVRFKMGELAVAQLVEAGILLGNIEMSQEDSMNSEELYSARRQSTNTSSFPTGRNGVAFGIKA